MAATVLKRWRVWTSIAAVVVVVGAVAAVGFLHDNIIGGTPTANPAGVTAAAAERKAAAEKAEAEQEAAAEAAALNQLESDVRQSMQSYFDDPANEFDGEHIVVADVGLVRTADNTYEGMASMSRRGGTQHDIAVHVTADDRNMMWKTDPGGLMPLFR